MWRTDSFEKTLMLGMTEGRRKGRRGSDGWMASPTWWTWVWVSSGSWWWTGKPGVMQSMGSQRVGHNWATELNWLIITKTTETKVKVIEIDLANSPFPVTGKYHVYLQGTKKGEWAAHAQEDPNSLMAFREWFLRATVCSKGCAWWTFFWLVGGEITGWCFGNLNHQPSGSNQCKFCLLVLSM